MECPLNTIPLVYIINLNAIHFKDPDDRCLFKLHSINTIELILFFSFLHKILYKMSKGFLLSTIHILSYCKLYISCYIAEILPIRYKTQSNQSINLHSPVKFQIYEMTVYSYNFKMSRDIMQFNIIILENESV